MDELVKLVKQIWVELKVGLRPCVSKLVTVDSIINIGPCIVHGATLAGDGQAADCQIYDGVNASGEEKAHLEVLTGTTFNWAHSKGCIFNRGIYVVVSRVEGHLTVTFKPITEKELMMLRG